MSTSLQSLHSLASSPLYEFNKRNFVVSAARLTMYKFVSIFYCCLMYFLVFILVVLFVVCMCGCHMSLNYYTTTAAATANTKLCLKKRTNFEMV